jgi:putative holliday junction resolvase
MSSPKDARVSPKPIANRLHSVVLGFDYGARRIGVAVGQIVTSTATPLTTLRCGVTGPDWVAIAALIDIWKPDALVVGLPGTEHTGAVAIKSAIAAFQQELEARFGLPVYTVDEAYTSVEAYERLKTKRRVRGSAKIIDKGEIDRLAAAIFLEAWMSSTPSASLDIDQ